MNGTINQGREKRKKFEVEKNLNVVLRSSTLSFVPDLCCSAAGVEKKLYNIQHEQTLHFEWDLFTQIHSLQRRKRKKKKKKHLHASRSVLFTYIRTADRLTLRITTRHRPIRPRLIDKIDFLVLAFLKLYIRSMNLPRFDVDVRTYVLHGVFLGPFSSQLVVTFPIRFVNTRDFGHQRIVRIWIAK